MIQYDIDYLNYVNPKNREDAMKRHDVSKLIFQFFNRRFHDVHNTFLQQKIELYYYYSSMTRELGLVVYGVQRLPGASALNQFRSDRFY